MDSIQLQHEPAQFTYFQKEDVPIMVLDLFRRMRTIRDFLASLPDQFVYFGVKMRARFSLLP